MTRESTLPRSRWRQLWRHLGATGPSAGVFEELAAAYSEDHRAYHRADHVLDCLVELDRASQAAVHAPEVEAALWFHDAVYDPRRGDNEERSADWAVAALGSHGVDAAVLARIRELIRVTRHDTSTRGPDQSLIVDIDLSILGRDPAEFRRYDAQIREEYAWVPEPAYREARARVLRGFLERVPLYRTPALRARYEAPARRNLANAVAAGP